jgi:hypothetical protein
MINKLNVPSIRKAISIFVDNNERIVGRIAV